MASSVCASSASEFASVASKIQSECDVVPFDTVALAEHLRQNGTRYFTSLKDPLHVTMERVQRTTNPVCRFVLSDGEETFRVIAKKPPVYPENDEALSEFQNYTDFNLGRDERCGFHCPRVLSLLRTSGVLLTEEEAGDSFRTVILRPSLAPHPRSMGCRAAVYLSGKWLSAFHQLPPSTTRPLDTSNDNPLLRLSRETNDRVIGILDGRLVHSLNAWRPAAVDIWHHSACRIGRRHGDFGPSNIVVGPSAVTVIDAAFRGAGPQLSDLAEFLTYPLVLSCAGVKSPDWYQLIAATFLHGYFGEDEPTRVERLLLQHLFVCSLLRSLEHHVQAVGRLPRAIKPLAFGWLKVTYGRAFRSIFRDLSLTTQFCDVRSAADVRELERTVLPFAS